jgi:hypothetical protein
MVWDSQSRVQQGLVGRVAAKNEEAKVPSPKMSLILLLFIIIRTESKTTVMLFRTLPNAGTFRWLPREEKGTQERRR